MRTRVFFKYDKTSYFRKSDKTCVETSIGSDLCLSNKTNDSVCSNSAKATAKHKLVETKPTGGRADASDPPLKLSFLVSIH